MSRPVVIVAHPGHELRLFAWMERERPLVCILTDGSGSTGRSRIGYSTALLQACDAVPGPVMGMLPDRAWYAAILAADAGPFLAAADAIGQATERGALVIADPVEGYNPMHDLCAALADRVAAGIAGRRATYPLMTAGGEGAPLPLDAAAEGRKRAAVATYAPLAEEAAALLRTDPHALLDERIMPAGFAWPPVMQPPPAYEQTGAARAAAGTYGRTIGYAAHVRPLALRLRDAPDRDRRRSFPSVSTEGRDICDQARHMSGD